MDTIDRVARAIYAANVKYSARPELSFDDRAESVREAFRREAVAAIDALAREHDLY